jgi:hypothetical protein
MIPSQRTQGEKHGGTLKNIQTPLMLEQISVNAHGELDDPVNGANLQRLVSKEAKGRDDTARHDTRRH